MESELSGKEELYAEEVQEEARELLCALGRIPAPSCHEEERAQFVKDWLEDQGAEGLYIDEAKNVIYPYFCAGATEITVFMAHLDVVFPDTEELPLRCQGGRIYAPGIGDDTANLVNLLLAARYVIKEELKPKRGRGVLFVADSGEEGLGNLKGCKAVMRQYGPRVKEFVSFDCYLGRCIDQAVGSHRYKVTVRTEGGHSYANFGNQSAIACLAAMVQELYAKEPPKKAKTTYNVGVIQGGSTINSIAEEASMLYEFRSLDQECLAEMEEYFQGLAAAWQRRGLKIEVETIGLRPCGGSPDREKLAALTARHCAILKRYYGGRIVVEAGSTDANIPLSLGIPANTVGTVAGGGAHTRGEWIETASLLPGLKVALACVLAAFQR